LRTPIIPEASFEDIDYTPELEGRIAEKFAKSGLQVIVKMASIELTPDKPDFPIGGWHVSLASAIKIPGENEILTHSLGRRADE
jgi:hypothetical protein